jgi:hypothetical protein
VKLANNCSPYKSPYAVVTNTMRIRTISVYVRGLFSVHSDYVIIYSLFVGWLVATSCKEETGSSCVAKVMYLSSVAW